MHIVSLPPTPKMIGHHASPLLPKSPVRTPFLKSPLRALPSSRITSAISDKRSFQLTPLWEHVVRTQSLPNHLDIGDFFTEFGERLKAPEWEVRQHALRVLSDVIPVMDETLDERMTPVLTDVVANLGHQAPAVRKGALEALRVYLSHSENSENILHSIVHQGLENVPENYFQGNVAVGIILSLPSLIFPNKLIISDTEIPNLQYIINELCKKLVQVTFQEVALRTLFKIRNAIGLETFDRYLNELQPVAKHDFDLLCQVYNLSEISDSGSESIYVTDIKENKIQWQEFEQHVNTSGWKAKDPEQGNNNSRKNGDDGNTDEKAKSNPVIKVEESKEDIQNHNEDQDVVIPNGKVILKTEIKLNSDTAITMTILEERERKKFNRNLAEITDSEGEYNNRNGVVKVIVTDDSEIDDEYEFRRRTPRRVRFGGEIVKLRTPDSDTVTQSDEDGYNTSSRNSVTDDDDIIEITLSTDENHALIERRSRQSKIVYKSHIPVPISPVTKVPKIKYYKKTHNSAPTSPAKTIPKRHLIYQSNPDLSKRHYYITETKLNNKNKQLIRTNSYTQLKTSKVNKNKSLTNHHEVEVLHNLQRSPNRSNTLEQAQKEFETNSIDSRLEKALVPYVPQNTDNTKNDAIGKEIVKSSTEVVKVNEIPSQSKLEATTINMDRPDSPIANIDDGASLTSSSGSDFLGIEKNWEDLNLVDYNIIADLHNKEDWRFRARGREELASLIRTTPEIVSSLESRAASLFHLLLSSERQPRLHAATEDLMQLLMSGFSEATLRNRLPQLAMGFARLGGPVSVRLTTQLMQKLTPATVADQFFNSHILSSRNTKVRENAMQIVMHAAMMFPSTEFNVASLTSHIAIAAADRKRRVRQAALETLAVLGQISSSDLVIDAVTGAIANNGTVQDKDGLVAAVRARLARRQLPTASEDGTVVYASPVDGPGADVDWIAAGSGSMSPSSSRTRASANRRSVVQSASVVHRYNQVDQMRNPWKERSSRDTMMWTLVPVNGKEQDEVKIPRGSAAQVWALDQSSSGNGRYPSSGGPLRPVYVLHSTDSFNKHNINGFPPLQHQHRGAVPEIHQFKPITRMSRLSQQPLSNSSSSSGTPGSPVRESRVPRDPRRNIPSGIPVPMTPAGGRKVKRHRGATVTVTQIKGKIPSAPVRTNEDKCNIPQRPILARQAFSSGSDSSDFFTPPAESYNLPEIGSSKSRSSISSHSSKDSFVSNHSKESFINHNTNRSPPENVSQKRIYEESQRNIQHNELQQKSTSIDSDKSFSFDESPIKNETKSSESDFEFTDASSTNDKQEERTKKIDEVDHNIIEEKAFDEKISLTESLNIDNRELLDQNILRSNICSAPTQSLNEINSVHLHETPLTGQPVMVKSLPGSVVDLNTETKIDNNISNPQRKGSLLRRPKLGTPKTPAGRRNSKVSTTQFNPFPDNLRSFEKPKDGLNLTLQQLENPEWEVNMTGLQNLVRLIRHHSNIIEPQLHSVVVALAKQIRNLRSQVARTACHASAEMFTAHNSLRGLEMEVEELATALLQRTADTNKFLRLDACTALELMSKNMSCNKVIAVLASRGANHHNAIVRCATAKLFSTFVERLGADRCFLLPRDCRDKLLNSGANMLMEGSLDTRCHAKQMFKNLSCHASFQRIIYEVLPATTLRNISKTLRSLN